MLYFFDKKRKTTAYFQAACTLKKGAANASTDEQFSANLYAEAYKIYAKIATNFLLGRETRGQAAYYMYLLAKEKKVILDPVEYHGMTLKTSEERCQNLLVWSASFGYQPAFDEPSSTRSSALDLNESSHLDSEIQVSKNRF